MIGEARRLYEQHQIIARAFGVKPLAWEELTTEQQISWAQLAYEVATQDRKDPDTDAH
jgi:hypothetical protein